MKNFKKGTPAFGAALGILFVGIAALWMAVGFWKMLLLAVLFAAGYLLGASDNPVETIREAVNRAIPHKEPEVIDLRSELVKEQKNRMEQMNQAEADAAAEQKNNDTEE